MCRESVGNGKFIFEFETACEKTPVPSQGPVRSWFRKSLTLKISLDSLCKILSSRHLKCGAGFRANQMDSNLQDASILSSRRLKCPFPRNAWCWFRFESHGRGGSDLRVHRHTELCTVQLLFSCTHGKTWPLGSQQKRSINTVPRLQQQKPARKQLAGKLFSVQIHEQFFESTFSRPPDRSTPKPEFLWYSWTMWKFSLVINRFPNPGLPRGGWACEYH